MGRRPGNGNDDALGDRTGLRCPHASPQRPHAIACPCCRPRQVLIVSYETFRLHAERFQVPHACDLLICDEAHRLKNDATLTNRVGTRSCWARYLVLGCTTCGGHNISDALACWLRGFARAVLPVLKCQHYIALWLRGMRVHVYKGTCVLSACRRWTTWRASGASSCQVCALYMSCTRMQRASNQTDIARHCHSEDWCGSCLYQGVPCALKACCFLSAFTHRHANAKSP